MQANVTGKRLLYHVLKSEKWDCVSDNNLLDSQFTGDAANLLKYIRQYEADNKSLPTIEETEEDLDMIFPSEVTQTSAVKRFKERCLEMSAGPSIDAAQLAMSRRDYDSCLKHILSAKAAFTEKTKALLGFKAASKDRYQRYLDAKSEGIRGILPPFSVWADNMIFENSTVNSLLGISSVGKSFVAGFSALHAAFVQGKKVLLVSLENSKLSMEDRMDAMQFHLDFNGIRQKILDFRAEERWKLEIDKFMESEGEIVIADAKDIKSIHDVMSLCTQINPDFVIIDGHYKLAGTDFKDSSALLQHTCNYAADTELPWLITSQLNIAANDTSGREAGYTARGNKGYFIDVRTVTNMTQKKELEALDNPK